MDAVDALPSFMYSLTKNEHISGLECMFNPFRRPLRNCWAFHLKASKNGHGLWYSQAVQSSDLGCDSAAQVKFQLDEVTLDEAVTKNIMNV